MRSIDYKRTALAFAAQMLMVAAATACDQKALELIFFCGAYIVPFVAYIFIFYHTPRYMSMPSALKMFPITIASLAATLGGSIAIIVLFTAVSVLTGGPERW